MDILQLLTQTVLETCVHRLLFESLLIILIVFLLFSKRSKKITLTEKEKIDLIKEYKPEPLVPKTSDNHPLLVRMEKNRASLKVGKYILINGQKCLNMATWNFLGLLGNKSMEAEAVKALRYWGVGTCGPRGFYGTFEIHLDCEERFEKFMNTEMAILYSHGSPTVSSTIASYSKRSDVIFCDEGASFPIVQGCRTSRSTVYYFRHNDMDHLEELLIEQQKRDQQNPKKAKCTRKYITVEAIYANIGDICPLPKIIRLRNKYKARIILDESISLGVLGKNGRGLTEHFGLTLDAVDIMSASLENSFASVGGISMGKSWIMWHQRMGSLGYAFSASQPPLCVATAIQAINILEQDTSLVEKCQNACIDCHVKLTGIDGLVLNGLSLSPVKHLCLAEPSDDRQENVDKLQKIVDFAQKEGIALTMANYLSNLEHILPEPSIRIAVSSSLLTEDIDKVASVIKQGTKEILFASCPNGDS